MTYRNYNDPMYKQWRKEVYQRDGYKCLWCGSKKKLQAHHIKLWAHYPQLRYVLSNGITLCKYHHSLIHGKEQQYERMLSGMLNPSLIKIIKELQ